MVYLDTSLIVPYFLPESTSLQVEGFLRGFSSGLAVSLWTKTEFSSAVGIKQRSGQISAAQADDAVARFRVIVPDYFIVLVPREQDFDLATEYLSHRELGLRSGDALHLAIAANHRAECLYSLDKGLISAAARLNVPAALGI
jgi:uncharacterized protein